MEVLSNTAKENNNVEVEFKLNADEFEVGLQAAYQKAKNKITIPGFRKGKAPRKMIEKQYGENVFYEDAVNILYQKAMSDVISELSLDVVDIPDIEVVSVNKDEGVQLKASFTTAPSIFITDYLGLKIEKFDKTVTDEDINAKLGEMQNKTARLIDVTDRPLEKGDTAIFDFKGFCDNVAFEGGSAENFSLEIGSGKFIPGFEDQMTGKKIGEDFDVEVTFPEDYNAKELAGKLAVFKCKIHEIKGKEMPALDDEFAKDSSDFDTLDELKADLREKIAAEKEKQAEKHVDDKVADALIDKVTEYIPPVMFEHRIDDLLRDWEVKNKQLGMTIKNYLDYSGMTMEQFREIFRETAEKQVKLRLALNSIAVSEAISISESDIEEEYKKVAEIHKMPVEKVRKVIDEEMFTKDLKADKALEIVKSNIKII